MTAIGAALFVIAGRADGAVRHADGLDQIGVASRMADSDRPWFAFRIASAEVEGATRIDGEILKGGKLACSEIDRQSLGHGPKIDNERAQQGDRLALGIEANVPIAARAAAVESRAAVVESGANL